MHEELEIVVNGTAVRVLSGTTVAAALVAERKSCRRSMSGEARGPLCGMGICFECRACIDGEPHSLTCRTLCRAGMEIRTDA
jgi:D-hydroxyproline dehydrogenase subunit gamma